MKLPDEGLLLRIFVGQTDLYNGRPVYEQVVLKARELGLAGATVTRGTMGFGATSRIHTSKLLRLSEDMPVIVEIVDREDRVELLLPYLDTVVQEGLVTMEKVRIVFYRHGEE